MAAKAKVLRSLLLLLPIMINVASTAAATAGASTPATPSSYINHTVGGVAGWSFNSTTNKTSTDFSAWAANQTFNLGDYLIFNTNTNQTVIQTYNETTYRNCTMDDASDTDTFEYQGGSNDFGEPLTIAVPLTIEGLQYYFSDADDGLQCLNGMAFEITVRHGLGLPPSLNQPPPPPYVEPPSTIEEQSPPVTIISSPRSDGMRNGVHFPFMVLIICLVLYLF
ncbi:hypothetical protein ACH5RR_023953 [Cinchona calisaya]|uniref:Phytocyanin domain-containing protein n=1 Tax=Cinchona calisaya TaxID=153742 RepID=A0ABD2ZC59_9GENT